VFTTLRYINVHLLTYLLTYLRCSGFVIATSSELPSTRHIDITQHSAAAADKDGDDGDTAQLVGEFYVLRYVNHREPVHGFLGRHLRRRLIAQSYIYSTGTAAASAAVGCGAVSSDLARVVDWLPRVWQKINKFLNVISPPQLDITIGNLPSCHLVDIVD